VRATATRAQLVEALLEFPARDRAEAARALLESLDDEDDLVDVETAWHGEISRRVQEIEAGAVALEDGPAANEQTARPRAGTTRTTPIVNAQGYRFHPAATEELDTAAEWYDAQLPGLSLELLDAVEGAIELIIERPAAWPRDSVVSGREI